MLYKNCLEILLDHYHLADDICIVDKAGTIKFTYTSYPQFYSFDVKTIVGRHILDVYHSINGKKGSLYQALKTGNPILNNVNTWKTYKGDILHTDSDTFPLFDRREIIGAVEISRFINKAAGKLEAAAALKPDSQLRNSKKYFSLEDIITRDEAMHEIKHKISRIASNDSSVLICGETGTGKELVAQSIHSLSDRRDGPFIEQNCAAIPESLMEAIFFGTEKGIYTGAESRKGLFEMANNGTLFLDEISSMDTAMQAKILKAVEDKKIMRIGGNRQISINVRIISALNREPTALIQENKLRSDLFYRLCIARIDLPPLRERKGDIELLTDYFIQYYNQTMGRNVLGASREVKDIFGQYRWPGNVRELKHVIESAFNLFPTDYIQVDHLPASIINSKPEGPGGTVIPFEEKTLKEIMEDYRRHVLDEACKNAKTKTEAAKLLGISKQSLNYYLKNKA